MSKFSPTDLERIKDNIRISSRFAENAIEDENELSGRKWFSYRFISPWKATQLFAQTYTTMFKRKFRLIDYELAPSVNGSRASALTDLKDTREGTQLWMARQRADVTGMRYEEYIEAALEFGQNRKRKFLPRPGQLHFPGEALDPWKRFRTEFWLDRLHSGVVEFPDDPAYRVEHFQGLPAQIAYRKFILEFTDASTTPRHGTIRRFAYKKRQVPVDFFAQISTADGFAFIMDRVESDEQREPTTPDPLQDIRRNTLWLTCFGLPAALDLTSSCCSNCPQRDGCGVVAAFVSAKVKSATGTTTPVDDRVRRMARDRKRSQRKRERSSSLASVGKGQSPQPGT